MSLGVYFQTYQKLTRACHAAPLIFISLPRSDGPHRRIGLSPGGCMTIRLLVSLVLAFAFAATSAMAADARSSSPSFKISPRGVTSIGSAAAAPSRTATIEADSLRHSEREAKHDAMLQKLLR